ncbi:MAG: hypothetical protein NTW75_07175 [Planctomycetales bacterium]|nr:hypothetical protein [Planctomycetales bacterium]
MDRITSSPNSSAACRPPAIGAPGRTELTIRVLIGVVWLIVFTVWFHSFELPNNRPAHRWWIWENLPFDLLDLIDPPVLANAVPWSWLFLGQRLPFLLIAGVIWVGALTTGSLALRVLRLRKDLNTEEQLFFSGCLGLSILSLAMLGLGLLGWMSRGPLLVLLLMSILGEVCLVWNTGTENAKLQNFNSNVVRQETTAFKWEIMGRLVPWMVAPFIFSMLLGAMSPQTDFDVVEYHLGGPKEWYQQGRITHLPHNVYTSFPFLTEMLLLSGMVLSGDWEWGALVGQATIAGFVPLTALGLYATGKRWFGQTAGRLAALVWLTTPWAYRISIIAYAEGGLACYLFAALAVLLHFVWEVVPDAVCGPRPMIVGETGGVEHRAPSTVRSPAQGSFCILCGLLAGSAMACKYTGAISAVFPVVVVIAVRAMRFSEPTTIRVRRMFLELSLLGLGVLVAVGPWLLKNMIETGNPVFPLAYSVFGGAGRDAELDSKWRAGHAAKSYVSIGERIKDSLVKLTDVVANNDWHSALMFALAPITLLASWRRKIWFVWGFIGWQFLNWLLFTHHIDRFYVPMFPAVALLAGAGASWLLSTSKDVRGSTVIGSVITAVMASNVLYNASVMKNLGGFNAGRTDLKAIGILEKTKFFGTLDWIDNEREAGRLPVATKVLCVGEAGLFHARFAYVYNTVFDRSFFEDWCSERTPSGEVHLRSADDIRAKLHQQGITHVLVNWSEVLRYRAPGSYGYTDVAHPDRLAELQSQGVLGPPLLLPDEVSFETADADVCAQIKEWATALLKTVRGTSVYTAAQIFPVQ